MMSMADTGATRPATHASALERMLQDPLIRLVMASDGVVEADIRSLARRVAANRVAVPSSDPIPHRHGCAGRA